MYSLNPLTAHYLEPKKNPLTIKLYHGSVTQKDPALLGFDLITCIELIEHLKADDLLDFQKVLFGFMTPLCVIISTPNVEFNILFPNRTGFRHPDHKFEWNRKEFQSWAMEIAECYNYTVEFTGVGTPPKDAINVGFCSQIAVFNRNYKESEESLKSKMECKSAYKTVHHVVYPSLQDEKYLKLAVLKVALLNASYIKEDFLQKWLNKEDDSDTDLMETRPEPCVNQKQTLHTKNEETTEPFLQDNAVYIPLQKLLSIPKVKELCGNIDILRNILNREATLSSDGTAIVYAVDLENHF
ncbi:hypothetical protein GDO86_007601 [Hymenochirus boettgeri]|uniref:Small RNA 2'-O-methyltransferase n=1 Tax=Hymenochirus boettgeri TaxID=247094 RepID=A0A8T2IUA0_9PIPI|nr:hypothetical protein GDO86_007601 [Hymenochirus boettgeri]